MPPPKPSYLQPQILSHHPPQPQRQAPPPPIKASQAGPTVASHKGNGKTKLNILNPMSLLARRRSSQIVEQAYSQNQRAPGLRLPDDYDPRIRGKLVHDFSAPRSARPLSAHEANSQATGQNRDMSGSSEACQNRPSSKQEAESPSSTDREHTPIFKENFDDDVEPWSEDMDSPAKRKSSAFVYQVSLQGSKPSPDPASLPAFARNLPTDLSDKIHAIRKTSTPSKNSLEVVVEPPLPHQRSAKSSPPNSPPSTRSRATSINDTSFQALGSPQRYKSNASRFSFDLAGVGSAAQEKLLEDKHREHAKKRERESVVSYINDMDDDDAYADFDLDDDDGGFEERIPGVNADADESTMPALRQAAENSNFISPNKSSFESAASQTSTGLTSPATPRDSQDQTTGLAGPKALPLLAQPLLPQNHVLTEENSRPKSTPGPSTDPSLLPQPFQREVASETNLAGLPQSYVYHDDDMYFDDGMIDDFEDEGHQPFDESVFDDDTSRVYGLPLRDLKPLPVSQEPGDYGSSPNLGAQSHFQGIVQQSGHGPAPSPPEILEEDDPGMAEMRDSITDLKQPVRASTFGHPAGLTQDNLGLHDKLAFAANQAALDGKFDRTYSQSSAHGAQGEMDPSQSLGLFVERTNHINSILNAGMGDESEDFAFDDAHVALTEAEDDDPIIAAANAEALENDDDGFYGQEFGFFARASGSSESEYVNGGYFGPRALEGIHRMNSGRDNFQEPSLTPITERSEWSNRNSTISLAMHGYPLSSQYQSNPQLVDLMRLQEGTEMSMEALKKLRRGAWGGSNASLHSNSNSQNSGSPLTYVSPGLVNAPLVQSTNSNASLVSPLSQNMGGSFHSLTSSNELVSPNDSDASPVIDDPTVTLASSQSGLMIQSMGLPQRPPMHPSNTMQSMGPPPRPPPPLPSDNSPVKRSSTNAPWLPGHKRNSSGAESVSYQEEGGKWFIERTRVNEETGEVEVVGRSEAGRI
ncbi:hypothetical protein P7C71_g1991, partial [Lecanoromycetidae sp. Uapishka_2]